MNRLARDKKLTKTLFNVDRDQLLDPEGCLQEKFKTAKHLLTPFVISRRIRFHLRKKMYAITTTVKDSFDTIDRFINHHRSIGITFFFIFLDDGNHEIYKSLTSDSYTDVLAIKCNDEYWSGIPDLNIIKNLNFRQSYNANFALYISQKMGFKWIAHIDIDELIYFDNGVTVSFLDDLNPNIESIKFELLEALIKSESSTHLFDQSVFKVFPSNQAITLAEANGNDYFEHDKKLPCQKYFRGHIASKQFTRVSSWQRLFVHGSYSVNIASLSGIKLLHFDCPNKEKFIKKMDLLIENFGFSQVRTGRVSREYFDIHNSELNHAEKISAKSMIYEKKYFMNGQDYNLFSALGLISQIDIPNTAVNKKIKPENSPNSIPSNTFFTKEVIDDYHASNFVLADINRNGQLAKFIDTALSHASMERNIIEIILLTFEDKPINEMIANLQSKDEVLFLQTLSESKNTAEKFIILYDYLKNFENEKIALQIILKARKNYPRHRGISSRLYDFLRDHNHMRDAFLISTNIDLLLFNKIVEMYDNDDFINFVKQSKKEYLKQFISKVHSYKLKLEHVNDQNNALKISALIESLADH